PQRVDAQRVEAQRAEAQRAEAQRADSSWHRQSPFGDEVPSARSRSADATRTLTSASTRSRRADRLWASLFIASVAVAIPTAWRSRVCRAATSAAPAA